MAQQEDMTLTEFSDRFESDEVCRAYLYRKHWPLGFVCPKCGVIDEPYNISSRNLFQCEHCNYQASVASGTIMDRSRTPLRKWFLAIYLITDKVWALLSPHLPGQPGLWGRVAKDNRKFLNGVFWILRTGAPWHDLSLCYDNWNSIAKRFRRWCIDGTWEKLLEILVDESDFEWLMIDASHSKVHPHATGAVGRNQDIGRTKRGLIARHIRPWMRMVTQPEYLLRRYHGGLQTWRAADNGG